MGPEQTWWDMPSFLGEGNQSFWLIWNNLYLNSCGLRFSVSLTGMLGSGRPYVSSVVTAESALFQL